MNLPTHCPQCNTELGKDEAGVFTFAAAMKICPAKLRQKLRYYASRDCMEIDGLGEKIIDQLVIEANLVNNYGDLYRLQECDLLNN